jgi:SH3-like domain-containing protein
VGKQYGEGTRSPRATLLEQWGITLDIESIKAALPPEQAALINFYVREIEQVAPTVTPEQIAEAENNARRAAEALARDVARKGEVLTPDGIQKVTSSHDFFQLARVLPEKQARLFRRFAAIFLIVIAYGFGDFLKAIPAMGASDEAGKPTEIKGAEFEEDKPAAEAEGTILVEVTRGMATIYKEPKSGSGMVNIPPKGSQLVSTGEKDSTGQWMKVTDINGQPGWIKVASIKVVEAAQQVATPTATTETTLKATPTPETTIAASEELTKPVEMFQQVYIPNGTQNLRKGPGTDFAVTGSVEAQDVIPFDGKVTLPNGDIWFVTKKGDYVAFIVGGKEFGKVSNILVPVQGGENIGGGEMTPEAKEAFIKSVLEISVPAGITVDTLHSFTSQVSVTMATGEIRNLQAVFALTQAENGNNTVKMVVVLRDGMPLLVAAHEDTDTRNAGKIITEEIIATANTMGEWVPATATGVEAETTNSQENTTVTVETESDQERQAQIDALMPQNWQSELKAKGCENIRFGTLGYYEADLTTVEGKQISVVIIPNTGLSKSNDADFSLYTFDKEASSLQIGKTTLRFFTSVYFPFGQDSKPEDNEVKSDGSYFALQDAYKDPANLQLLVDHFKEFYGINPDDEEIIDVVMSGQPLPSQFLHTPNAGRSDSLYYGDMLITDHFAAQGFRLNPTEKSPQQTAHVMNMLSSRYTEVSKNPATSGAAMGWELLANSQLTWLTARTYSEAQLQTLGFVREIKQGFLTDLIEKMQQKGVDMVPAIPFHLVKK